MQSNQSSVLLLISKKRGGRDALLQRTYERLSLYKLYNYINVLVAAYIFFEKEKDLKGV